MNQPLNTYIQVPKLRGHKASQASSSSDDSCILSSLHYHLPNMDNVESDTLFKSESVCVSLDWQRENLIGSESKEIKEEENVMEINSELMRNVATNGQQHINELTEDQGASIEVTLEAFDEGYDDNVDRKWLHRLKTDRTSSKIFKCAVCGKEFGSLSTLKKHKATHISGFKNRFILPKPNPGDMIKVSFPSQTEIVPSSVALRESLNWQRDDVFVNESKEIKEEENLIDINSELIRSVTTNGQSIGDPSEDRGASVGVILKAFDESGDEDMDKKLFHSLKTGTESSFSDEINLHHEPKPYIDNNNAAGSEAELPSLAAATHSLPNSKLSSDNRSLLCHICGETFTNLKSHMTCHTEQSPYLCCYCGTDFDNYVDCETHQGGQCRFSKQHSQDDSLNNMENPVVSSVTGHDPTITDAPANSQAMKRDKSSLTCQKCGRVYTYKKNLKRHQSKCLEGDEPQLCESLLSCKDCGRRFVYDKNFEKHLSKCPKRTNSKASRRCKPPITCQDCGRVFVHNKNFEKHQSKCSKYFVISGCNFQSAENSNRNFDDENSESAETPISADPADDSLATSHTIKCTMCEKKFSKIGVLNVHYLKAHKVRDAYPCSMCKRIFVRLCELVQHQQNETLFQCSACKKCFSKSGRNDHQRKLTTCTPFVCDTCGRSFKYHSRLLQHQREHKEQSNVCSYCGKQCSTKRCLRRHMVRHTGGYPCTVCGKKFFQKNYLNWHMYKHTGKAPYLCDTCGKGWPTPAQLKLHMIQHSEERPFKCEDCGINFKKKQCLIAHRRAVHIRLRPFVCEVCSKAFRINSELKQHTLVHTGERPFRCSRCGKKFKTKSYLRKHCKKPCR